MEAIGWEYLKQKGFWVLAVDLEHPAYFTSSADGCPCRFEDKAAMQSLWIRQRSTNLRRTWEVQAMSLRAIMMLSNDKFSTNKHQHLAFLLNLVLSPFSLPLQHVFTTAFGATVKILI